jgi:DNA-binding MarR family transcriptional regulator
MGAPNPQAFAEAKPRPAYITRTAASEERAAARSVAQVFEQIFQLKTELSVRQGAVLSLVVERPGEHTVATLHAALKVSKPALSRVLDRLRDLNLAHRRIDPKDRRVVLVDPTPKGRAWVLAVSKSLAAP